MDLKPRILEALNNGSTSLSSRAPERTAFPFAAAILADIASGSCSQELLTPALYARATIQFLERLVENKEFKDALASEEMVRNMQEVFKARIERLKPLATAKDPDRFVTDQLRTTPKQFILNALERSREARQAYERGEFTLGMLIKMRPLSFIPAFSHM